MFKVLHRLDRFDIISIASISTLLFWGYKLLNWCLEGERFDRVTDVGFIHLYIILIPLANLAALVSIIMGLIMLMIRVADIDASSFFDFRVLTIKALLSSNILMLATFIVTTEVKTILEYDIRILYLALAAVYVALLVYCNTENIAIITDILDRRSYEKEEILNCLESLKRWCSDDKYKKIYADQIRDFDAMATRVSNISSKHFKGLDISQDALFYDLTNNMYTLLINDKNMFIEKSNLLLSALENIIVESERNGVEAANRDVDKALSLIEVKQLEKA